MRGMAGTVALSAFTKPVWGQESPAGQGPKQFLFPQGVASGDPQPDAIVFWTRVEDSRAAGQGVTLRAQVATDPEFTQLAADEKLTVGPETDNTLRLLLQGLTPDTTYYYRFRAGQDWSPLGRTRTAPAPDQKSDPVFAFASCQNYEQGFYGAWARMLANDRAAPPTRRIQFVLFLGDFIYEVRGDRWDADMRNPTWLKDQAGKERAIPQFPNGSAPWPTTDWNINPGATNAVTLADYRMLYRLYLSDPYLQAARARWPFVCTWDDHEFSNDSWQAHDTYFDQGGRPAQTRKVAANQAWFEYIPAILTDAAATKGTTNPAQNFRPITVADTAFAGTSSPADPGLDANTDNLAAIASMTIYRSLRWGRDLEIFLTDNRSYKTAPPDIPKDKDGKAPPLPPIDWVRLLDAGRTALDGKPPATMPGSDIANPRRESPTGSVLGQAQKAWFKAALKASDAQWKVWANSFPALPMRVDLGSIPMIGMQDSCLNLDGWMGYPGERQEILAFIREQNIANVVVCAGDHHAHMAGFLVPDLDEPKDKAVALEFACAGLSSEPQFKGVERAARSNSLFHSMVTWDEGGKALDVWNMTLLTGAYRSLLWAYMGWDDGAANLQINRGLHYADTNANGYGVMSFTAQEGRAELITTADSSADYGADGAPIIRSVAYRFPSWAPGTVPVLYHPEFSGQPAFPFDRWKFVK